MAHRESSRFYRHHNSLRRNIISCPLWRSGRYIIITVRWSSTQSGLRFTSGVVTLVQPTSSKQEIQIIARNHFKILWYSKVDNLKRINFPLLNLLLTWENLHDRMDPFMKCLGNLPKWFCANKGLQKQAFEIFTQLSTNIQHLTTLQYIIPWKSMKYHSQKIMV